MARGNHRSLYKRTLQIHTYIGLFVVTCVTPFRTRAIQNKRCPYTSREFIHICKRI